MQYCGPRGSPSYRSENSRRIVVDGIDTGAVLPEKEHAAQEQTPHNVLASAEGLEGLPESKTDGGLLIFKSLVDGCYLLRDVNVVGIQLADPAEVLHRLAATILEEKPARGFLDPQCTSEKHTGRDDLDGKGDDPLLMVLGHVLFNAVLPTLG